MTAGMNSIREQAHARQHHILDQYVRAHTERKCAEFLATIPRLDQEIVASGNEDSTKKNRHNGRQAMIRLLSLRRPSPLQL